MKSLFRIPYLVGRDQEPYTFHTLNNQWHAFGVLVYIGQILKVMVNAYM